MAAIMALIFLPALAATALIFKTSEGASSGVIFAKLCFMTLAMGLFYGLFRLGRRWENEPL